MNTDLFIDTLNAMDCSVEFKPKGFTGKRIRVIWLDQASDKIKAYEVEATMEVMRDLSLYRYFLEQIVQVIIREKNGYNYDRN